MKTSSDTKEKILDLAKYHLQARGYYAFSYHQVSSELGIKNAAVHYHYPTKSHLANDVLIRFMDWFKECTLGPEHAGFDPWKKLDWLIAIYRDNVSGGNQMCLIGALSSDYLMIPDSLKVALNDTAATVRKWLTSVLEEGLKTGVFDFKGKPSDKASLILTSLIGVSQVNRTLTENAFEQVIEQIKQDLIR